MWQIHYQHMENTVICHMHLEINWPVPSIKKIYNGYRKTDKKIVIMQKKKKEQTKTVEGQVKQMILVFSS